MYVGDRHSSYRCPLTSFSVNAALLPGYRQEQDILASLYHTHAFEVLLKASAKELPKYASLLSALPFRINPVHCTTSPISYGCLVQQVAFVEMNMGMYKPTRNDQTLDSLPHRSRSNGKRQWET